MYNVNTVDFFSPNTIETDDGIYVRLKDSIFSISRKDHVIKIDETDNISLVTVTNDDGESYQFWSINDEVCKLYEDIRVKLPKCSYALNFFTDIDDKGYKVIYVNFEVEGCYNEVVRFAEGNVDVVISKSDICYDKIRYIDGVFYACDKSDNDKNFAIILNNGTLCTYELKSSDQFIVKGFEKVAYGKNNIRCGNTEVIIKNFNINKVEVINNYSLIILKVISDKGNYYYDEYLNCFCGPTKNETVEKNVCESSVYIYLYDEYERLSTIYYINKDSKNHKYDINKIQSEVGIKKYPDNNFSTNVIFVCQNEGALNVYANNLKPIICDAKSCIVNAESKIIIYQDKSNKFYLMEYGKNFMNEVEGKGTELSYLGKGISSYIGKRVEFAKRGNFFASDSGDKMSTYIFKSKYTILCIEESGKIIFDEPGRNCKVMKFGSGFVYVIENQKELKIFTEDGVPLEY